MTDLEKKKKELDAARDAYQNRGAFNYDVTGDALYDQYKNQYKQRAEAASSDAIGKASAMTGGYGNSYAQMLGQQAYANEMAQFGEKENQLYQAAMDRYDRETNQLLNKYNMLSSEVDKEMAHEQAIADANARAEEAKHKDIFGIGEALIDLGYAKDAQEAADMIAKITGVAVDGSGTGGSGTSNGTAPIAPAEDVTKLNLKKNKNGEYDHSSWVLGAIAALDEAEKAKTSINLEDYGLTVTKRGKKNVGGGINRDAQINFDSDEFNADNISLIDLRRDLMAMGYSKEQANEYINRISKNLGIDV